MSVLACGRRGCNNIMCDRYSYIYGYLCNECFEELVETKPVDINHFMNSIKTLEVDGTRERYEEIFPDRHSNQ